MFCYTLVSFYKLSILVEACCTSFSHQSHILQLPEIICCEHMQVSQSIIDAAFSLLWYHAQLSPLHNYPALRFYEDRFILGQLDYPSLLQQLSIFLLFFLQFQKKYSLSIIRLASDLYHIFEAQVLFSAIFICQFSLI